MDVERYAKELFRMSLGLEMEDGRRIVTRCKQVSFRVLRESDEDGTITREENGAFVVRSFHGDIRNVTWDDYDWSLHYDNFAIFAFFDLDTSTSRIREVRDSKMDTDVICTNCFTIQPEEIRYRDAKYLNDGYIMDDVFVTTNIGHYGNDYPFLSDLVAFLQQQPPTFLDRCYLFQFVILDPEIVFTSSSSQDERIVTLETFMNGVNYESKWEDDQMTLQFKHRTLLHLPIFRVRFRPETHEEYLRTRFIDLEQNYWPISSDRCEIFNGGEPDANGISEFVPTNYALESVAKIFRFQTLAISYEQTYPNYLRLNQGFVPHIFNKLFENRELLPVLQWNSNSLIKTAIAYDFELTSVPQFLLTIPPSDPLQLRYLRYTIQSPPDPFRVFQIPYDKVDPTSLFLMFPSRIDLSHEEITTDNVPLKWMRVQTHFAQRDMKEEQLPPTCFDLTMGEDAQLQEFLNEDRDHIVFLFESPNGKITATCLEKSTLHISARFYPCLIANSARHAASVQFDMPFYRLMINTYAVHISSQNFSFLLRHIALNLARIFYVVDLPEVFTHTISEIARLERQPESWVSADHCQDDSDKRMSMIIPVNLTNAVQDASKRARYRGG